VREGVGGNNGKRELDEEMRRRSGGRDRTG